MCRPVDAMYSICTKQVDHILMTLVWQARPNLHTGSYQLEISAHSTVRKLGLARQAIEKLGARGRPLCVSCHR